MDKAKEVLGGKKKPSPKDSVVKGLQKALDICNTAKDLAEAKAKIQAEIDGTA